MTDSPRDRPRLPVPPPPAVPASAPPAHPGTAPGHVMAPAAPPSSGLLPWALGLLVLFPFPFVGAMASGIAMAAASRAKSRRSPVGIANARSAGNWGLTYLVVSTGLLLLHFVLLFVLTMHQPVPATEFPVAPIVTYVAVSVLHLVLVIVGTLRAGAGKIMKVPFAIPFFRA